MAELKTKKTEKSVAKFLGGIKEKKRREDCQTILEMMEAVTGETAKMWGTAIVGFGDYHYVYASGREGDWFIMGFSPRKQNISIYLMCGLEILNPLLEKLGQHKTGKGCLYLKSLDDVDQKILKKIMQETYKKMKAKKK